MLKYPSTLHLPNSGLQNGDSKERIHLHIDQYLVIEEKLDGANVGISFVDGKLMLQSRGHYLVGGPRERHYSLLKAWANRFAADLKYLLGERFIMYGEWLAAKHTVFYNALPHLFYEFDMWDQEQKIFLSTSARRAILDGSPVMSVPVLTEGYDIDPELFVGDSLYINAETAHTDLQEACEAANANFDMELAATLQPLGISEGVYVKIETESQTVGRGKFVRGDFVQTIIDNKTHWLDTPLVYNKCVNDIVDMY